MTVTRLVATLMTAGAFAALAACGGDAPAVGSARATLPGAPGGAGQASSNLPDPCTLITRAQAEQAMGNPAAGPGTLEGGPTERTCSYKEGQDGPGSVTLHISDHPDSLKQLVAGTHVDGQPVSGLGDEAIFAPGLETLFVRKGSVAFTVQVATLAIVQGGRGSGKDVVVQLATSVLAQL